MFYWLGKIKRKRSTGPERFSDLAIAGACLVAVAAAGITLALVLPSGDSVKNVELSKSSGVEQLSPRSDADIWGSFAAKGWTQESTNSTEAGPWLRYDPPGTRYCRNADGTIQRIYPPGLRPNAQQANPFCLHDSTRHVPQ